MIEQSNNLLLSLVASGLINGNKIPFVDLSIANVMETYILRCLRNSSLEDILALFSIEDKDQFILMNNHGLPFPFARFTGNEEVFLSEMEKKANRPLIRPSSPLVLGELYVVNKAGELIIVKSFRLRNYMVNNHFLKNGNLVLDLYLNKHQALVALEKGALVSPVSEHSIWTLFQKDHKIYKEGIDKVVIQTELLDKEKYIIVGKRNADISLNFESCSDNIYAAVQGIPLYETQKNIEDKWYEIESITFQWYEQKCLLIQIPDTIFRQPHIELGDKPISQYKSESLEESVKALVKSRWVIFNVERKRINMNFSFSRFQESIYILKKKTHEILLLPRHTIENRKLIRGIISSIESTIASINRILWAKDLLKISENVFITSLLEEEKVNLKKLLAIVHDRYLYYFCLIKIDEKVHIIPSSDIIIVSDENLYYLNVFTLDLRENNFVNFNLTFITTKELQLLRMLLDQKIAFIEFNNGELKCFKSWKDIKKGTEQLTNMPLEIRGYLIGKKLCKENGILDYPKLEQTINKGNSIFFSTFLKKKLEFSK